MKKIFLLFIFIFTVSLPSFYILNKIHDNGEILGVKKKNKPFVTPTPFVMPENTVALSKGEKTYWMTWVKVEDKEKLFLYPNFTEKDAARSLIEKKKCKSLINGSYYTKDDKPLGLFLSENVSFSKKNPSALIPVIFYVSADNREAGFVTDLADKKARIALQVGPVLVKDGKARRLSIRDDEMARRIILALAEDNQIIFITAYKPDAIYDGPYLTNLPDLLLHFREKTGINLSDAVNLDGGSASVFYDGKFFLEELSYIGSYFCVL